MANDCPCNGCVAPKRHPGCHAECPEYTEWSAKRRQHLEYISEMRRVEDDLFPNYRRKRKKRRR